MGRIIRIPLRVRYVELGSGMHDKRVSYLTVQKQGIELAFESSHIDPVTDMINFKLTNAKIRYDDILVTAQDALSACEILTRHQGWNTGSGEHRYRAVSIDVRRPIVALPHCPHMWSNKEDELTCGEPDESGVGESGMCFLAGFAPPDFCPVSEPYERACERVLSMARHRRVRTSTIAFQGLRLRVIEA
ncbi:MAG: hypothetical protein AAB608_00580 [Patescibacteria group bacterium]